MEIFEKMTQSARKQYEWAEDNAGPDDAGRTLAVNEAVEEALQLMRKMAENARDANEDVFRSMQSQIDESVAKVEKTAKKAGEAAKKSS